MARNKYFIELKEKKVSDFTNGESITFISNKFGISHTVISPIIARFRVRVTIQTVHSGGRPPVAKIK